MSTIHQRLYFCFRYSQTSHSSWEAWPCTTNFCRNTSCQSSKRTVRFQVLGNVKWFINLTLKACILKLCHLMFRWRYHGWKSYIHMYLIFNQLNFGLIIFITIWVIFFVPQSIFSTENIKFVYIILNHWY